MPNNFRSVPWKRNLRKIPPGVRAKLAEAPETIFVAGVARALRRADIQNGVFSHMGISLMADGVVYAERVRPLPDMGPFSKKNREGWEVVRDDLPMITRSYGIETPNFGDWGKGSHTLWLDREVYQRDYYEPTDFEIVVEQIGGGAGGDVIFKFTVDFPLDRGSPHFDDDLLFALNLLQENLEAADILPRDAARADLLATLDLEWEIFPPGTIAEVVQRTLSRMGRLQADQEALVRERVALFNRLKPRQFIQGRGGMNRYIGALFADDLVVFENVKYGNALYVLYDDWREVSQRSRIDLLKCRDAAFDRFVHCHGWQTQFAEHIRGEKRRRGIKDSDRDAGFRVA
jgi:hypothetical protein